MYGNFAPNRRGRFALGVYFPSEQAEQCWYLQVKWKRNETEEKNVLQFKIIANIDISSKHKTK